jgi:hypothetical protein
VRSEPAPALFRLKRPPGFDSLGEEALASALGAPTTELDAPAATEVQEAATTTVVPEPPTAKEVTETPAATEAPRPPIDRYGFAVTSTEGISEEERRLRQQDSEAELRREERWVKMMAHWDDFKLRNPEKLELRVRQGIPDCVRSRAWQFVLDLNWDAEQRTRVPVDSIAAMATPASIATIDADVARVMPQMVMFSQTSVRDSLRKILIAYANLDPELGYVQGMAYLAAMLLSYLDEARAFWCFMRLMAGEKFQFRRLYQRKFEGLNALNTVWEILLSEKYKKVAARLKAVKITSQMYTAPWFLTAFMGMDFPAELRLRIFDRYVAVGCRALLSFGMVIMSRFKELLLRIGPNEALLLLLSPEKHEKLKDWRTLIVKYDKLWIYEKDYDRGFKKAGLKPFN